MRVITRIRMYMPMSESDRVVKFNSACILCRYGVHSAHIFPFSWPWLQSCIFLPVAAIDLAQMVTWPCFTYWAQWGFRYSFLVLLFSMNFLPIFFDHCRSLVMSCRVIWSLYVALSVYSKVKNWFFCLVFSRSIFLSSRAIDSAQNDYMAKFIVLSTVRV